MKADIEGPCGEVTRAEAVRHVVTMRAILRKEREMRSKDVDSVAKDEEIQHLRLELEHEQVKPCLHIVLNMKASESALN